MSLFRTPHAYLVMSMMRARGALVVESETICFDRELAIAMAQEDHGLSDWSGVYPLDGEGRCVAGGPIFSIGSLMCDEVARGVDEDIEARPPRSTRQRPANQRTAAQRTDCLFVTNATASKSEAN